MLIMYFTPIRRTMRDISSQEKMGLMLKLEALQPRGHKGKTAQSLSHVGAPPPLTVTHSDSTSTPPVHDIDRRMIGIRSHAFVSSSVRTVAQPTMETHPRPATGGRVLLTDCSPDTPICLALVSIWPSSCMVAVRKAFNDS